MSILELPFGWILTLCAILLAGCSEVIDSTRSTEEPCQCEDLRDIANRVQEARAAIEQYRKEIEVIKQQEATTGEAVKFNGERRKKMQQKVQDAINTVTDHAAHTATGLTTPGFCEIEVNAPTACLRKYLQTHEGVHKAACQEVSTGKRIFSWEGYFTKYAGLTDYAVEEIASYEAELLLSQADLERLQKQCSSALEITGNETGVVVDPKGTIHTQLKSQGKIPLSWDKDAQVFKGSGIVQNDYTISASNCALDSVISPPDPIQVEVKWTEASGTPGPPAIELKIAKPTHSDTRTVTVTCIYDTGPKTFSFPTPRSSWLGNLYYSNPGDPITLVDWNFSTTGNITAEKTLQQEFSVPTGQVSLSTTLTLRKLHP